MGMSEARLTAIAPCQYPWEREALAFVRELVRERLPDYEPYRAWSNFEFIADDGRIYEVDLLVVSPKGVFLVEIESRPGLLEGDHHTWTWTTDGRRFTDDNPLLLANRKAKRLKSLFTQQRAAQESRVPFIVPLVFCSAPDLSVRLDPVGRSSMTCCAMPAGTSSGFRTWRRDGAHIGHGSRWLGRSGSDSLSRHASDVPAAAAAPEATTARAFEARLRNALDRGAFLALTVRPRELRLADRVLTEQFALERVSLEALLIGALRTEATAKKVDWNRVLTADAAPPDSRDWTNLKRLVTGAIAQVEERLHASHRPLLLTSRRLARGVGVGRQRRPAGAADDRR